MSIFRYGVAKTIQNYFSDRNEREYIRLLLKWGRDEKYHPRKNVRFLDYAITVPDPITFVGQFEEIFLKESYKFTAANPEPVIVDCGANIGMSCLYFKRLWPKSKVVAFEADPKLFTVLGRNLAANGIHDVQLLNKAVWIENTHVKFSVEGADGGSIYGTENLTEVQAIRLKEFLESYDSIDLLKIDIEGAEDEVVLDCAEQLHKIRNIFIEYHSWKGKKQKLGAILSTLEAGNFRYQLESTVYGKAPLTSRINESPIDLHVNIYGFREN